MLKATFSLLFLILSAPVLLTGCSSNKEEIQICEKFEAEMGKGDLGVLGYANCLALASYVVKGNGECEQFVKQTENERSGLIAGGMACGRLEAIRDKLKKSGN